MRDPFSWSFPLGRMFGITLRVHVLFPLFAAGIILWAAFNKNPYIQSMWPIVCAMLGILFTCTLLHEFGHCFGARMVDGEAQEVLLWPLGGLAAIDVPHTPRANFIATAAGPAVNLLLCVATALLLTSFQLVPPLEPWDVPLHPKLYNWSEGAYSYYEPDQESSELRYQAMKKLLAGKLSSQAEAEQAARLADKLPPVPDNRLLNSLQTFLARVFWINWVTLLLNLLPGFPLDGGRMLQCILWWRMDFRQATLVAIFCGFAVALIMGIWSIVGESMLPLLLGIFIYMTCRQQWFILETGGEESLFGYDFSQGYTSLERDQPMPRPRRPNFIRRWLQRRAARKLQREQELREAEERRMDELLEKVQQQGLQALTDEERRFLTRVSARYRRN